MGLGAAIPFIKGLAPKPIDPADVDTAVAAYLEEHPEATCPIDDTAGEGDTGKVWSAEKTAGEVATLKEAIGNEPEVGLFQKCVLFTETSKNKYDKSTELTGYLHTNGTVYTGGGYDNYCYNSIGQVEEGDIVASYTVENGYGQTLTMQMVVAYDSNGVCKPELGTSNVTSYTVPSGVASVKVTYKKNQTSYAMVLINPEETPQQYIPYSEGNQYYIAGDGFVPKSTKIAINLPSKLYALTGYELNVYFEDITENYADYEWDCSCDVGKQLDRGFRFTPIDSNAGNHTLTIKATAKDGTVTTATTTIVSVAESAGSGVEKSLIVLGDSTTANGTAVSKVTANFADDVMDIVLKGTQGTSPNMHEGRSGWKFSDYFTRSADPTYPSILNGFYNPTSQTFDASYYFANSGVTAPDWFFINLGINDVFGYDTDTSLNTQIDACITYCNAMIQSIKTANANIKIGVCVTIPPNHSQDAFGKAYGCSQTRARYKRNNTLWANRLIQTYDKRTSENIYIVPINVCLDTIYNMGMESDYVNARNTSVTYSSPVANGGVHPAESGYWQIADMYTAFLKANV